MISLKPSNVGWLGNIPTHWEVIPSKRLFSNPSEQSRDGDVQLTPSQKYGVLTQEDYMQVSGGRVVLSFSEVDTMKHVEPGDFISHLRSFQGGLEYSSLRGKISGAYTVLRPSRKMESRYYKYLFKSNMYVQGLQTTTDQLRDGQSIKYQEFGLLPLPLPPIKEQTSIADFLDTELSKIDKLVEKNELLLIILLERRKAAIEALVQGKPLIEISGSKQDSGWLSAIPTQWRKGPLKWYTKLQTGATPEGAEYSESDGFPWLRPDDLDSTGAPSHASRFIDVNGSKTSPIASSGSVLMCCIGATLGKVGILDESATFNQQITSISSNKIEPKYLFYVLSAAYREVRSISVGNTLDILNNSRLGTLLIPLPPREEQLEIVELLDRTTKEIDKLIQDVTQLQIMLAERRTILISEAVMGHFLAEVA